MFFGCQGSNTAPSGPRWFEDVSTGQDGCDLRDEVAVDANLTQRDEMSAKRSRFGGAWPTSDHHTQRSSESLECQSPAASVGLVLHSRSGRSVPVELDRYLA